MSSATASAKASPVFPKKEVDVKLLTDLPADADFKAASAIEQTLWCHLQNAKSGLTVNKIFQLEVESVRHWARDIAISNTVRRMVSEIKKSYPYGVRPNKPILAGMMAKLIELFNTLKAIERDRTAKGTAGSVIDKVLFDRGLPGQICAALRREELGGPTKANVDWLEFIHNNLSNAAVKAIVEEAIPMFEVKRS